ncbi:MAG: PH domain-containing protein [Clostridia bacterium]|nr:PH domain-containing protein [Clostridia bacterium]
MKMNQLPRKALKLFYIRCGIAAVAILGAFIPAVILASAGGARTAVLICAGIPVLISLAFLLILPYYRYKLYAYGFDEKRIVVRYGVIFRHSVTIPVCQIQDLHRFEGPIMMLLGLGGVTISTAGSNFNLACLLKSEADLMIEVLEGYLEKRVEEKANEEIQ